MDNSFVSKTYYKKLKESLAKSFNYMVDLHVKFVSTEQWSPSNEDGVCDFKNTDVDLWIGGRKTANEFLIEALAHLEGNDMDATRTHLRQCVPSTPEIRICDHADSITKLSLNIGRGRNHEAN